MTKPMTMTKHPHRPRVKAVLSNSFLSHLSFLLLLLYAYRNAMRYRPRGRKPREEPLSQRQMRMKPETRHFEEKLHPGPNRRVHPKPKKEGEEGRSEEEGPCARARPTGHAVRNRNRWVPIDQEKIEAHFIFMILYDQSALSTS